jgi:hypothetical protein
MHAMTPSQYHLLPGSGAYLSINSFIVNSNYNAKIRDSASTDQVRQRLIDKEQWTQTQYQ